MLQILGLRSHSGDAFYENGWRAPSVRELFRNLPEYLKPIPMEERWNLFFTANECSEGKREFFQTPVIWFDLDGIDVGRVPEYRAAMSEFLGLAETDVACVFSGNGLHFYAGLKAPIVSRDAFHRYRSKYREMVRRIDALLAAKGLPGKADKSVFDHSRIMRLPGTKNIKPKGETFCELLQPNIREGAFDLEAVEAAPEVEKDHALKTVGGYVPDPVAVFQGCEFLKWAKENPADISEPEWYAALSIVARLKDGRTLCHDISKGHPKYSATETERKIDQAVIASGPRTCAGIQALWGECGKCPHFGNITSPIMLRDPNEIPTQSTGFYHMVWDKKHSVMRQGLPDYEGLVKYFQTLHPFIATERTIWIWNGLHYEEMPDDKLRAFAQKHFKPECRIKMVSEFQEMLYRTNVRTPEEWHHRAVKKINFQNGVLDLETDELREHSPEYGFKHVLPYAYDPGAEAPRFQKFLDDVTGSDPVLKSTLLEFGGYALAGGNCEYQKALVLEGEGSNGKSTFIEVVKALAGRGAYSALSFSELSNPDRRSPLDGALFNITEETPAKLWDTTTFKNLVSGGELHVRRLYKNAYPIRNKAKLIFSCNELPSVTDTTRGFYRRFLIVPFRVRFAVELGNLDVGLLPKLLEELPGIFNLVRAGYKRLEELGRFTKEGTPDRELEDYRKLSDPLQYWLEECAEKVEGASTPLDVAYASYRAFCVEVGYERSILPMNQMGKRLKAQGFSVGRTKGKKAFVEGLKTTPHGEREF